MSNTSPKSPPLTHQDLSNFTGDLVRYRHSLNKRVIYTPGVKFLAERGKAYWLIDAMASYFGSPLMNKAIEDDERLQWIQFWRLKVAKDHSAILTARADQGVTPFISQKIEVTDFPLKKVEIWAGYDHMNWTLYLPSEH